MIGQVRLQAQIDELIANNNFPRFLILEGRYGSGKKLMANNIAKKLGGYVITIDTKVDAIRNMIERCYKLSNKTVYIIPDADTMSLAAKNALLKVTEEPPNNAYFIMTVQDVYNTLETLRSRAIVYRMDNYTSAEIASLVSPNIDPLIYLQMCETPYDVMMVKKYGIDEFMCFVNLVVDNIAEVSSANVFKIGDKVSLAKDDADKYDLRLFWQAFIAECLRRCPADWNKYCTGAYITTRCLHDIQNPTISKQMTFDKWLLDIRKEWM